MSLLLRRRAFAGGSLPYLSDADLYVWDNLYGLTIDSTLGVDSISEVAERSGKSDPLAQPVKANMPLVNANGAEFDGVNLTIEGEAPTLNSKTGVYAAVLLKWDVLGLGAGILQIRSNNPAQNGRLRMIISNAGGWRIFAYADELDGNNNVLRLLSPGGAIAAGTWHLVEVLLDVENDTGKMWVDQTEVVSTLSNVFTGTSYPATDGSGLFIYSSFDGVQRIVATYDGIPPDDIRASISDYMMSLKP